MASGDTLVVFVPQNNEPPASNPATLDVRNGYLVLDFDDTNDEEAIFRGMMPQHYGDSGVTAHVIWSSEDQTTGNVVWQGAFLSVTADADDLDSKAFAAFQTSGAQATASATGEVMDDTIAFTDGAQMDSTAAGEMFFFKLRRDVDGTSGTDSLTNDAELWLIELRET